MRFTAFVRFVLILTWVRITLSVSLRHGSLWSVRGFARETKELEARAGTNTMKQWIDRAVRQQCYRDPTFDNVQGASTKTSAEIRELARDGYLSVVSERAELSKNDDATLRPTALSGGDLTATLHVPGMGDYSASLPKGGMLTSIRGRMETTAPELSRQRAGRSTAIHAEDAVLFLFESRNPGWLAARGGRYPPGTTIAVYGRYNVKNQLEVPGPKPPCSNCALTLGGLGITSVSLP